MADDNNDEYFVPLEDQRVFGAGIKRKRIDFVPAAASSEPPTKQSQGIGDKYLAIVFSKNAKSEVTIAGEEKIDADPEKERDQVPTLCPICQQVITSEESSLAANSHATSIAHQVCMEHSYPPSHLERTHVGLQYLSAYGWDPDSRTGLGPRQEGIRFPVKAKEKNNTAGLGLFSNVEQERRSKQKGVTRRENNTIKLNAKDVRKLEADKAKRAENLRKSFYAEDLSRYLGTAD